jgi:peptidoglycan/xylan/chitin deacetylase (PgdA/CDA1 family)
MIRSWIKTEAARVLCRTGIDQLVGSMSGARRTPLVIGYHRVVEDFRSSARTSIPALLVSQSMLERHLDWIGRRYRFVDLNELGILLESGRVIEEPVAAVTFDDGYQDFYDHALPTLEKKGVPAALFVVTGLVGSRGAQIHDKLYLLLARRRGSTPVTAGIPLPDIAGMTPYRATRTLIEAVPLAALRQAIRVMESEDPIPEHKFSHSVTWEMLDRIRRAGIVIGSHTQTHIVMTNETRECVLDELVGSRQELERRLGTAVHHFAYPSGIYNSASVSAVAAAGYRFGFTTCAHRNAEHPLLTVPRTLLWENSCLDSNRDFSESIMSCQVHRVFDFMAGCRQHHVTPTATLTQGYGNAAI